MSDKNNRFPVKRVERMAPAKHYQKIIDKEIFPPVCMCNYKEQADMNRKIYQRNIPNRKKTIIPDHRPSFKICNKIVDLNDPLVDRLTKLTKNTPLIREGFTSNYNKNNKTNDNYDDELIRSDFIKAKKSELGDYYPDYSIWNYSYRKWAKKEGQQQSSMKDIKSQEPPIEYLRDIDIDSHLRQGFKHSECPEKRYNPKLCEEINVDNPNLLDSPYCENYKVYQFNDMTKDYCPFIRRVSKDTRKQYRPVKERDQELVDFNYRNDNSTCNDHLRQVDTLSNLKQPILFQFSSDIDKRGPMPAGPNRTDHKIENVWNNITKRTGI